MVEGRKGEEVGRGGGGMNNKSVGFGGFAGDPQRNMVESKESRQLGVLGGVFIFKTQDRVAWGKILKTEHKEEGGTRKKKKY